MTSADPRTSARLGAVALALLVVGTAVILAYTLLDIPWQQRLGGWNYLISLGFFFATTIPVRLWRPDPRYPATSPDGAAPEPRARRAT